MFLLKYTRNILIALTNITALQHIPTEKKKTKNTCIKLPCLTNLVNN